MRNEKLTNRERQVLCMLPLESMEIANRLFISLYTVKTHINSLANKFSALNRTQILVNALKNKVIELEEIILE